MGMLRLSRASSVPLVMFCAVILTLKAPVGAALADSVTAESLVGEAMRLKQSGQRVEALAKAREAIAQDAGSRDARWIAAWVLAELGRTAEAIQEFSAFSKSPAGDERLPEARAALTRLRSLVRADGMPVPQRSVKPAALGVVGTAGAAGPASAEGGQRPASSPSGGSLTVLSRGRTQRLIAALTIDLGESATLAGVTSIAAYTSRRHIPCAWFVTSWFAKRFPEFLRQFVARGDEIGNHTQTHPHCRGLSEARIRRELVTVEDDLAGMGLAITTPKFFRPPYGEANARVVSTAASLGYTTVMWTATSTDYEKGANGDRVARTILAHVKPGAVILNHATDVSSRVIPKVVDKLLLDGYRFVPLRDVAALGDAG